MTEAEYRARRAAGIDIGFPDDWILPGEFRFCDAGLHLLPYPIPQPCECCQGNIVAMAYAESLLECRNKLAAARRDGGVPRLAWMKEEQSQ